MFGRLSTVQPGGVTKLAAPNSRACCANIDAGTKERAAMRRLFMGSTLTPERHRSVNSALLLLPRQSLKIQPRSLNGDA